MLEKLCTKLIFHVEEDCVQNNIWYWRRIIYECPKILMLSRQKFGVKNIFVWMFKYLYWVDKIVYKIIFYDEWIYI